MMQAVLNTVNPIQTAIRSIFVTLDMGIYDLLKFMYELFFNIATNNIIDREMIFNIFSRVQLVIGIFMMFQLVMIVIKGIVNPDSFTDSKSGGAGSMVMRIIVALALLAVIVPINIPSPRNEYEKQINNNGLLFGTLYSLQYRVLANNTLGRLILGTENEAYTDGGTGIQDLSLFANRFTSTIVRMFYTLNTDDNGNYVCNDGFDSTYNTEGINPNIIIINGTQACGSGNFVIDTVYSVLDPGQVLKQGQQYRVTMNWLSTIIGIVLVVLFFMMIFNVAKRVFKLAALQLIAPIPIISYMDPKGSKDGAFNSWVKMLATTYLELFVQLAVVYFSFAIINSFITKFFNVNNVTSAVGNAFNGDAFHATGLLSWTFIIMTIALFIFAKDAPKFLKQALGIKDNGQGFFSAFGTAMGLGVSAVGAIGSARAGFKSSQKADETRKSLGENVNPDSNLNKAKHVLAGIFGGAKGLSTGASAALNAKDHNARAAWDAIQKQNAAALARGNDGSTLLGRLGSTASGLFMGEGASGELKRQIATRESQQKALDAIKSRVSGEMVKQDWTYGTGGNGFSGIDMATGLTVSLDNSKFNHKSFMAAIAKANAAGLGYIEVKNQHNATLRIDMSDADIMKGNVLKYNEDDYIQKARLADFIDEAGVRHNAANGNARYDQELVDLIDDAEKKGAAGSKYDTIVDDTGAVIYTRTTPGHITTRDDYTKVSEQMGRENRQAKRANIINEANDQHSGNKK